MKSFWTFLLIGLFQLSSAQYARDIDYVRTHAKLAVEEMELYNIPASITLSQGILETGGGQSRLAEIANNHFGIKCKSEWTGPFIDHDDDLPKECFRKYGSVQESYRDHSKFLAERPYYTALFKLDMLDYKAWAHGLKKAGYATNPKYPTMLINIIERNQLEHFDRLSPTEVEAKLVELYGPSDIIALSSYETKIEEPILAKAEPKKADKKAMVDDKPQKKIEIEKRVENPLMRVKLHPTGINYIEAYEGEDFKTLAKLFDYNPKLLAAYNELPVNGKIRGGQFIFFGRKKTKGINQTYVVQEGDSMYLISQKTGMQINRLYKLNRLKSGEEPKVGTILNLQKRKG